MDSGDACLVIRSQWLTIISGPLVARIECSGNNIVESSNGFPLIFNNFKPYLRQGLVDVGIGVDRRATSGKFTSVSFGGRAADQLLFDLQDSRCVTGKPGTNLLCMTRERLPEIRARFGSSCRAHRRSSLVLSYLVI